MKPFILFAGVSLAACSSLEERPSTAIRSVSLDANPAEVTPAPSLKLHQYWTYRRFDLWRKEEIERFRQEMTYAQGSHWTVRWTILDSTDAARQGSVTREVFDAASHAFADGRMKGRHEPLRFPLAPGKTWKFDYTFKLNAKEVKVAQTASVQGWEMVNVPAGSFRALRVEHLGRYEASEGGNQWQGKIQETYWYAPAAGRIVKREYRDTQGNGSTWDQWREELVDLHL